MDINPTQRLPESGADEIVTAAQAAISTVQPRGFVSYLQGPNPMQHRRAGITKNHNKGQSKQRRRMAKQGRRQNRGAR